MKKHKLIASLAIFSILSVALPASAQEVKVRANASTTPLKARMETKAKIEDRRAEIKTNMEERRASSTEKRAEMKTEFEARKASSTAKRIEMQQGLAKRKAEHTAKVLMATIERLLKLVGRVESRIEKMKAEGKDVVESERFIAEAKAHLSEAKASLSLFTSIDLSGEKARDNLSKVKEAATTVKTHIRAAHQSLMKAIRSLKNGRSDDDRPATTTNATSTSN